MHGRHLEATINLKAELESVLRRCRELGIEPEGVHRPEVSVEPPSELSPLSRPRWAPECSCSFLSQPWLSLQIDGLAQGPGRRAWGSCLHREPLGPAGGTAMGPAEAPLHLMRLSTAWGLP